MRIRLALAWCTAWYVLAGAMPPADNIHAQSVQTDFSGRWVLDRSRAPGLEPDTLVIAEADELIVKQTQTAITIEHPSRPGTHPAPGVFEFGSGGRTGGLPGTIPPSESRWGTTFFGTQLQMSESTTSVDANGVATTSAYGSIWLLDKSGRLVIEFREEHSGERPKIATRIYTKKR